MRVPELAQRYARALFQLAKEQGNHELVLTQLRELMEMYTKDENLKLAFTSPLIRAEDRMRLVTMVLEKSGVTDSLAKTLIVMAKKGRLPLFQEFVHAFENQMDLENSVCRGNVRSATVLAPNERSQVEGIVEKRLQKKVILTYSVDPQVVGGLIAEVGSFTFDDTIKSHLKRMNDELKRRTV